MAVLFFRGMWLWGRGLANGGLTLVNWQEAGYTTGTPGTAWLEQAVVYDPLHVGAWRGLALSRWRQGETDLVGVWQLAGENPHSLWRRGQMAEGQQQLPDALGWYAAAIQMSNEPLAWYSWAALWQQIRWHLSEQLPIETAFSWSDYVAWNEGNWMVNGDFEAGLVGWSAYRPSGTDADFGLMAALGHGQCALITGKTEAYHGGWNQPISLVVGEWYVLTADLWRVDLPGPVVDVLYWEGYADGRPSGNMGVRLTDGGGWQTVSVLFPAPISDESVVQIYPVRVSGRGRVCVDNVQLRLVEEERP